MLLCFFFVFYGYAVSCFGFMWCIYSVPLQWPPALRLFTQPFIPAQITENIEAPRHWPLCGEFTGDRGIPRTNGQLHGNASIWWRGLFRCNCGDSMIAPNEYEWNRLLSKHNKTRIMCIIWLANHQWDKGMDYDKHPNKTMGCFQPFMP